MYYFKKNNKGQYWTGSDWSFNKARRQMYDEFKDVCATPKEGRIQMDKPDTKDVYNAIRGLCEDAGLYLKSWDQKRIQYNIEFGELSIRVHWNKNDDGFSVGTKLTHPTKGHNQLWRNYCTLNDVRKILINPREHIGLPVQRVGM